MYAHHEVYFVLFYRLGDIFTLSIFQATVFGNLTHTTRYGTTLKQKSKNGNSWGNSEARFYKNKDSDCPYTCSQYFVVCI